MDFQANLAAFEEATKGEFLFENGEWLVQAVETQETIEQFVESSTHWAERTTPRFGEIVGLKFVEWKSMQMRRGQTRDCLTVVDFGDRRIAISARF